MIITKKIIPLIIAGMTMVITQSVQAESLRDALARTVHQNPDIRIAQTVRNASIQTMKEARGGYLPTVDLRAGYAREQSTSFDNNFTTNTLWRTDLSLTGRQMLFDGFATDNEVKRNQAKATADAFRVWGESEDKALLAVQAYLNVLRNQELVRIAQINVEDHQGTFGIVKRLGEQGLGREADTEQSAGRLDLARANLKSAQNDLEDSKITYQKITGAPPEHLLPAPNVNPSALPRSEQEALKKAIQKHPTLKSASADIVEARGQHNASKSKMYPRIDFIVNILQNKNVSGAVGPDHDRLAGVEMNYNLFRGGTDLARIRETAYNVQQATEIRNRTELQLMESTRLSWEAYTMTGQRIPLLISHERASELTTQSYRRQFELAKRTSLDLLDSQDELYSSRQDLINERYSHLLAKYRLLNDMGELVEYFNISLPAEACPPYQVPMEQAHYFG